MTLERGAGEAQTRPPAPVSRPENLPEPQTLAPHNTRNGASFRVARTKLPLRGILALATLIAAATLFVAPAAQAAQVRQWKLACVEAYLNCDTPANGYAVDGFPLLKGINPHNNRWNKPMRRLARWLQDFDGKASDPQGATGKLDTYLKSFVRPYLDPAPL